MPDEALLKFKKIYRAKIYIDYMCKGIDPISKLPVPSDSVIRQEKIINCFSFISGLLDEMLMNFGEEQSNNLGPDDPSLCPNLQSNRGERKPKKAPFHLQQSQIKQIKTSRYPLAISTFIRRINNVIDKQSIKSIRSKDIQGWLIAKGFIQEKAVQVVKEEKEYIPAKNAADIGIVDLIEQRDNGQPDHHAIKLSEIGQQFILDNIDEIAEFAKLNK